MNKHIWIHDIFAKSVHSLFDREHIASILAKVVLQRGKWLLPSWFNKVEKYCIFKCYRLLTAKEVVQRGKLLLPSWFNNVQLIFHIDFWWLNACLNILSGLLGIFWRLSELLCLFWFGDRLIVLLAVLEQMNLVLLNVKLKQCRCSTIFFPEKSTNFADKFRGQALNSINLVETMSCNVPHRCGGSLSVALVLFFNRTSSFKKRHFNIFILSFVLFILVSLQLPSPIF